MTQGTQAAEVVTAHHDVHSEQGALRGEHPGRAKDPVIKARGLAWLEFEKTDLDRTELFARDFGLTVHSRTPDELQLRASRSAAPCVVVRRGERSRFVGAAFEAADARDLDRLASATGASVEVTFYDAEFDEEDEDAGRESRDDFLLLFVGPTPQAIMQAQRDLLVEDVVQLMERHFDGSELGGVVSEIDKLFSARFDALVNSLQIGKPPRGTGGTPPGHGGGRRPRHLH